MKKRKHKAYLAIVIVFVLVMGGIMLVNQQSLASWVEEEEGMKYESEDGEYVTGFVEIEGDLYYFNENGYLVTGKFYVDSEESYYYADADGVIQTGVIQDEQVFYIADDSGRLLTGFLEQDGKRYYFNENVQLLTGWFKYDGNWYYADGAGVLQTGFVTLDGYRYYLDENGCRVNNAVMEIDGITYLFNQDGSVDENATAMYPVYQYLEGIKKDHETGNLMMNSKVQACAVLRASELSEGFKQENDVSVENLLKNRGIKCAGGYEFSYGGVKNYDVNQLISDMEKDYNIQRVLQDTDVREVGMGLYEQDNIFYYDIIFIKSES